MTSIDRSPVPKRSLARRLLLGLSGLVGLLVMLETGMDWRYIGAGDVPEIFDPYLLRVPHRERGWTIEPDATALLFFPLYSTYIDYNRKGLRGVERPYHAKPDVYRILLLGDSFMEGYQHADDDLFASRLERALAGRSVEIINLSVGGYGTTQQYLYLRDEGLKYQPDLVLLAFQPGNDIVENSQDLLRLYKRNLGLKLVVRPYARFRDGHTLEISLPPPAYIATYQDWRDQRVESTRTASFWNRLLVVRYVRARFGTERAPGLNPNVHYGAYVDNYDPDLFVHDLIAEQYKNAWTQSWLTTQRLIASMARLAARSGAEFALLNIPARIQVDRAYLAKTKDRYPTLRFDLDRIDVEAERFARTHAIPMLNLTPVF